MCKGSYRNTILILGIDMVLVPGLPRDHGFHLKCNVIRKVGPEGLHALLHGIRHDSLEVYREPIAVLRMEIY